MNKLTAKQKELLVELARKHVPLSSGAGAASIAASSIADQIREQNEDHDIAAVYEIARKDLLAAELAAKRALEILHELRQG